MLGPKFFRTTTDVSVNIAFPRMMRTHIERGIASCSTGYDRTIMKKSLGEALERHICFSDADDDFRSHVLSEFEPIVSEWFIKNCDVKPEPEYKYSTIEITELSTKKKYIAPSVAFYLGDGDGSQTYGARDSSGTALHQSWESAFKNCRDEFCERQSLTLFWYFGHCLSSVVLRESAVLNDFNQKLPFIPLLLLSGDILIYDISYFSPVRTIMCVYLSDTGAVRFAAGASGDADYHIALEKALLEMYQAYVLMRNLMDERARDSIEITDSIIEGYLSHNCQDTVDKFKRAYLLNRSTECFLDENIQFKKDFYYEPVFLYKRKINYVDRSLFYCVIKSIYGFKTMSLNEIHLVNNLNAAKYYGYEKQINKGHIPFA